MFDIGATELLLVIVVAILVIGPKDMPLALRTAGRWVGKVRKMSAQFRSGFDNIVREAELDDMEKKWKAQNEQIMRDNPEGVPAEMEPTGAYPASKSAEKDAEIAPDETAREETVPEQTVTAEEAEELRIIAEKEREHAIIAAKEADAAAEAAEARAASAEARVQAPTKTIEDGGETTTSTAEADNADPPSEQTKGG